MLTIQNLSKTYGNGVKALDEVNLTLEHGLFGLLGPNGSGKSFLMRTMPRCNSRIRVTLFYQAAVIYCDDVYFLHVAILRDDF